MCEVFSAEPIGSPTLGVVIVCSGTSLITLLPRRMPSLFIIESQITSTLLSGLQSLPVTIRSR